MSILTLAQYYAARKQIVTLAKNGTPPSMGTAPRWMSTAICQGGDPAAMSASGNTTTGVVPTNATTGAPYIEPFSGTGYITGVDFSADFACRVVLYDRLFHAGSFATSVGVTSLSTQPSYSSRVPGGTDYTGTQIWVESFINITTANTFRVQYTNQAGTAGQISGAGARPAGLNVGNWCVQLPLADGDTGVQTIENFEVLTSSISAAGLSVFVARPLWTGRVQLDERSQSHWLDQTGMPQVFSDSCLCLMHSFDANEPKLDLRVEIASA